jgi:hypothetical protein
MKTNKKRHRHMAHADGEMSEMEKQFVILTGREHALNAQVMLSLSQSIGLPRPRFVCLIVSW